MIGKTNALTKDRFDEGYNQGLEDATPTLQEKSVTPSAYDQTITPDSNYDGLSQVVVSGDADLVPENIAKGITIFDVTGTMAGGEGGYCWAKIDPTTIDTNTLLLLHADSFSDSGGNDVYVSSGGTTISEAQSKFGGKSFYFDGSSYMTIGNDIVLGTGNFTIDFWVYRSSSNAAFRRWITSSIGAWTGNTFCVRESNTSAVNTTLATSSTTIASGAWHHIAVVRNGSTQTIYIDGVSSASVSDSTNYSEPIKYIGGCYKTSGTEYFVGYMDEIRISNTARWTSNFTVPTSRYEEEKVLGYVLSDNKDEYPVNGFHTDGYYYRRLDDNIPWYEEGSYYWSKSDTDGNFIAYVVSDQTDEFPEDGTLDGYYYKLQQGTYDEGYEAGLANGVPPEMITGTAQISINRNGTGTVSLNCQFDPMFVYAHGPSSAWGNQYASAVAWKVSPTSGWTKKTAVGNAIAISNRKVSCTFSCGDNFGTTATIYAVGYPD